MRKKPLFGLLLIFTLTIFLSGSAAAQDNEKFIQKAVWRLSGQLPKNNQGHSMAWFLEWTFTDGKFLLTGYPPLKQEGKYRIVKTEENKLTLELFDQSGNFGTENKQIEIIIDRKNNKLKINGKEGFKPSKAKS